MKTNCKRKVIYMLYKDNEGLKLSAKKVRYIQNGEEIEQFVGSEGTQWWIDFANKWEHTNIIEFVDVVYTAEQLARYEEVKAMDINESVLQEYVENGMAGQGLEVLALKKENEELRQLLADLTETVLLGGA